MQVYYEKRPKDDNLSSSDSEKIKSYNDKLLEVFWLMCVQEPPMSVQFTKEGDEVTGQYGFYEEDGQRVVMCVWPAVYSHKDGQLLAKGRVIAGP